MRTFVDLSLIDLVVLFGVGVVCPLAIGGRARWWLASCCGVLLALLLPTGIASAAFVLPWLVTAGVVAARRATAIWPVGTSHLLDAAPALAAGYAVVGSISLIASRLGWRLFGIDEPIVELTAMHYTFAGTAALVLAVEAHRRAGSARTRRFGVAAVALTAATPPLVAVGFVTGSAMPQVGGAVLLASGVWTTSSLSLIAAADPRRRTAVRLLLTVSGLATWIPMVLAVAWAAGQHWDLPAMSIPDMARTHGLGNALAFVLCGLVARRIEAHDPMPVGLPATVVAA